MAGSTRSCLVRLVKLVGGGDRHCIDRFRGNSTGAFFDCDGARCGEAGVSKPGEAIGGRTGEVSFRSKNDLASVAGVIGVAGPLLSTEDVSLPVLVRKLRSMV